MFIDVARVIWRFRVGLGSDVYQDFHVKEMSIMSVDNETSSIVTIRASGSDAWAEIELEYSWSSTGTLFSIRTKRVRAADNGRSKGNIKLALVSAVDTGWKEMNDDDGVQNGQWYTFDTTLSVAGNNKEATIHFNWIYDQAFPRKDINMTGQKTVLRN